MSGKRIAGLLGNRSVHWNDVVLCAEVGSTAHGINIGEQDDTDYTVVRMEPWREFVNFATKRQSMMIRTQPEGVRSRFGDIDLNVYTLRKFGHLATSGNPSILGALFSPSTLKRAPWIDRLSGIAASKAAGTAFLGYMRQQMERWQGTRGQKNVSRPELVEAYGFDTKYAAHIIRLGYQGIEYLGTGRLTLPIPEPLAGEIRALRTGEVPEQAALDWAAEAEDQLKRSVDRSPLPESPGWAALEAWLDGQYGRWFGLETG